MNRLKYIESVKPVKHSIKVKIMETRTFLHLSPEECLQVYPEIIKNAEEFYITAKLLAEANYYGKAVTHLILGAEEYIKSFCLFLEGNHFELRKLKGIKGIFYGHTARHNIIRDSFSVWMVAKHFFSININETKNHFLQKTLHAMLSIIPAMSNHDWWAQADMLKQKGLYVDYQNQLILPSDLTKKDYEMALRFTQPIPKEVEQFIQNISRMSKQELKSFRDLFREADFESLIVESLHRKS